MYAADVPVSKYNSRRMVLKNGHFELRGSQNPALNSRENNHFPPISIFNLVFGGVKMEGWDPKNVHIYVKRLDSDYTLLIHTALQWSFPILDVCQLGRQDQSIAKKFFTSSETRTLQDEMLQPSDHPTIDNECCRTARPPWRCNCAEC